MTDVLDLAALQRHVEHAVGIHTSAAILPQTTRVVATTLPVATAPIVTTTAISPTPAFGNWWATPVVSPGWSFPWVVGRPWGRFW